MADPHPEPPTTTHTYVAIAWYKDWQTWFNILSVIALLLQESSIITIIPERYHGLSTALVTAVNVILRFATSTRPVALSSGVTREVATIPPKTINGGSVSNSTRLGLVLVLAFAASDCAKPPPNLTPEATAAFHATRVVKALDLVMDTAIAAEAQTPKVLSTANTRKVVEFHQTAVRTIHAVPNGWKPTVTAALNELQAQLGSEYAQIAPYVNLVQTLIASLP